MKLRRSVLFPSLTCCAAPIAALCASVAPAWANDEPQAAPAPTTAPAPNTSPAAEMPPETEPPAPTEQPVPTSPPAPAQAPAPQPTAETPAARETMPAYGWRAEQMPDYIATPAGTSLVAGGGFTGFFNQTIRDVTSVGGDYNVRLTYGTRTTLGMEVAYIGSTQSMDALGLDRDALLFANGVEGMLRLNVVPNETVQPFLTVGVAWRHYTVRTDVNTSNVRDSDDTFEIPANLGLALRARGFVADMRVGYRQSFSNDLLGSANLSSWNTNMNVGFEF